MRKIFDENSSTADNVLSQIRTGMRGIFLMQTYTKDSLYTDNDKTLDLIDLARYGLFDDSSAFLEKDNGVIYRAESFPSLKANPTLDEVFEYITNMLSMQPTVTADTTTGADNADSTDGITADTAQNDKAADSKKFNADTSKSDSNLSASETEKKVHTANVCAYDFIIDEFNPGHCIRFAKDGTKTELVLPKPLDKSSDLQIETDTEWVYFGTNSIYRCRLDGSDFKEIYDGTSSTGNCKFKLIDDTVIVDNNSAFYIMNKDGNNVRKIWDQAGFSDQFSMTNDGDYFYDIIKNNDKYHLNKVSISDGSIRTIHTWDKLGGNSSSYMTGYIYLVSEQDGWIYYRESVPAGEHRTVDTLKRIRSDGTGDTLFTTEYNLDAITVRNGCFYYIGNNQSYGVGNLLYKFPLGSPSKLQSFDKPKNDHMKIDRIVKAYSGNHYLYVLYEQCKGYFPDENHRAFYRINLDGSNATLISEKNEN